MALVKIKMYYPLVIELPTVATMAHRNRSYIKHDNLASYTMVMFQFATSNYQRLITKWEYHCPPEI